MLTTIWSPWCVALAVVSAIAGHSPGTVAACVNETPSSGAEAALLIHLSPGCTQAEREARVVLGEIVMEAIAKGRTVDLSGVIVRGDLMFDRLAVEMLSRSQTSPQVPSQGEHVSHQEQRLVRGPLRIRNSAVSGALRHGSATGILRFEGPVDFQGSHFKEGVDLSRSVFHGIVELSSATFEKEAFFVQGQFAQQVLCRETKFGPSTRFHQSTFRGSVDFAGALFDGMAEFLEVSFEQPATFERSRFGLGTGFSGSRFKSRVSFSDAIFSRETFFGFAAFESEAVFAGSQFLGPADFSNAEFRRQDDLAKAHFDQPPLLTQTKRLEQDQSSGLPQTRKGQYVLTLVLLIVAALLVAYAMRLK